MNLAQSITTLTEIFFTIWRSLWTKENFIRLLLIVWKNIGSITINLPPSTLLLTAVALMMALYAPLALKSEGTLLESMDVLFIGRKKMAGKSVQSPLFGDILFSNDYKVDKFVEQHPTRSGEGANVACADFLAGSTLRSKSRYAALSETAIFGRACRHEFPKRILNMKHGERLKGSYRYWSV